jgi:uncharacterized protein (DUF1800 family)
MTPAASLLRSAALASARAAVVATLCVTLTAPEAFAASPLRPARTASLTRLEKTQHALNRFSFGPRPGEVAAVSASGVDAWFQQQLHPNQIDDSAFEARLQAFPAMQLSQAELLQRFPGPQELRRMEKQGIDPVSEARTPEEKAIYADALARYKFAKKAQEQGKTTANMAGDPAEVTKTLPPSKLTRADLEAMLAEPPAQRFQSILALEPADALRFGVLSQRRAADVLQGFTPQQKEVVAALGNPARVVATETLETRLLRDAYSRRQLQAVMTDFWLNHFSVYVRKNQFEPYLLNGYQRDVILPNSLGNFEQLLVATAKSPAMLMYLDNWESVGPNSLAAQRVTRVKQMRPNAPIAKNAPHGINENYARELMELHTVGVNGGYTQKDIIEVAKCFTGWTIRRPYAAGEGTGEFYFDASRHEPGPKTVLGVTIPEGGMQEGLTVLHMLATSPKTAHFISQKLAVRFVSDNPPPALVDRMAATFLKTGGDTRAVLETLFHSPEFWSPAVYRAKVKTPIEFLTSALRASDAEVTDPALMVVALDRLGMPVYGMQTPNGYSWQSADWVSTGGLVNRMNFSLLLSGDHVRGTHPHWPAGLGDPQDPKPATEAQLETLLLGGPVSAHTRDTVLAQFRNPTVQQEAQKGFTLNADLDEQGKPMAAASDDTSDMAPKSKVAKGKTAVSYFRSAAGGFSLNADQPESPLDTMAGLLLGSPDFQRR